MKRFEELPTEDTETILRVAANREGVIFHHTYFRVDDDKNVLLGANFSVSSIGSDRNTVEVPFSMDLTTVSEFVKMFPVACFNAKCVDSRMKQC